MKQKSCFSFSLMKHHHKVNLFEEKIIWVLQFRRWVYDYHGGEHGSNLAGMTLERWLRADIFIYLQALGMVWALETSKFTHSDSPPLTRPHLIPVKQFQQLQTKFSKLFFFTPPYQNRWIQIGKNSIWQFILNDRFLTCQSLIGLHKPNKKYQPHKRLKTNE